MVRIVRVNESCSCKAWSMHDLGTCGETGSPIKALDFLPTQLISLSHCRIARFDMIELIKG